MQSILYERLQTVIINGTKSDYVTVTSGVPQGTILAPLLFIVFINDISLDAVIFSYVDDTKIFLKALTKVDLNPLSS